MKKQILLILALLIASSTQAYAENLNFLRLAPFPIRPTPVSPIQGLESAYSFSCSNYANGSYEDTLTVTVHTSASGTSMTLDGLTWTLQNANYATGVSSWLWNGSTTWEPTSIISGQNGVASYYLGGTLEETTCTRINGFD